MKFILILLLTLVLQIISLVHNNFMLYVFNLLLFWAICFIELVPLVLVFLHKMAQTGGYCCDNLEN